MRVCLFVCLLFYLSISLLQLFRYLAFTAGVYYSMGLYNAIIKEQDEKKELITELRELNYHQKQETLRLEKLRMLFFFVVFVLCSFCVVLCCVCSLLCLCCFMLCL
jgi:hypothetical protein